MKQLLRHARKEYKRSPFKKERQFEDVLKGILIVYMVGGLTSLFGAFPDYLNDQYSISKEEGKAFFLLLYPLIDLISRFFLHRVPKLNTRPYLALPIPKKRIIRSILLRSVRSVWFYLFLIGYIICIIITWNLQISINRKMNLTIYLIGAFFLIHFLNFYIKTGGKKLLRIFFGSYLALALVFAAQKFGFIDLIPNAIQTSNFISSTIIITAIPLLLSIGLIYSILKMLPKQLSKAPSSSIEAKTLPFQIFSKFGPIGKQIDNEVIMSLRLKAVKNMVLTSLIWIVYPLIIGGTFRDNDSTLNFMFIMFGMFISYGMIQYASYAFSWHTYHFNALQMNKKTKDILWGKYYFMILLGIVASIIGTIFYFFISKQFIQFIWVGLIYNIAISSFLSFYFSIKYAKPKNPYKSSALSMNNQEFNLETIVISFIYVLGIMIPYGIGRFIWNHGIGLLLVIIVSVIFIAFNRLFMKRIMLVYNNNRYKIYNKFKQFEQ